MSDVDWHLDEAAIEDLGSDEDVQAFLQEEVGDPLAADAADLAPKASGEGAASIQAEVGVDTESAYVDVSWDKDHFYMGFAESGTERQPPTPFLRPALDSFEI